MKLIKAIAAGFDDGSACDAGAPLEDLLGGACPAEQFNALGLTDGDDGQGEPITYESWTASMVCMCDVTGFFQPMENTDLPKPTCATIADFQSGPCTDEGLAELGMVNCAVETADGEDCPEDQASPTTKDDVAATVALMYSLSCD
jgi:hypothetical protein